MASNTPATPGIMTVISDVLEPTRLSRSDFDTWYINEHIPDVVAKSGIQNAQRYDHINDGTSPARKLGFLTLYGMQDIGFMETEEFRSLEGQRPGPSLERIFRWAEFDTRAYELVQVDERSGADPGPAPFLLYAAMSHTSDLQLDAWYRGEHVAAIARCPGYCLTRRFKLVSRSILSAFERSFPPKKPTWLALHEFEGPEIPWEELKATDETEWAKTVVPGIREIDFGLFGLRRMYGALSKSRL